MAASNSELRDELAKLRQEHDTGFEDAITSLLPALQSFQEKQDPGPAAKRSVWLPEFDEGLPKVGIGEQEVINLLKERVIPRGIPLGAPGFSGWITTAPQTTAIAAKLASTVCYSQRWWCNPGNFLEMRTLEWLRELLGLPTSFHGTYCSGGAVANLLGLGAARQAFGETHGVEIAKSGTAALPKYRVYAGAHVHRVVARALAILGLGSNSLCVVPMHQKSRIDLSALKNQLAQDRTEGIKPLALVASAGDVNRGWIDPISEFVELAAKYNCWLHVDGAYGAFGVVDDRKAHHYRGFEQIDSLAFDPHKWLGAPTGCGAILCKNPKLLERAFAVESADYVKHLPRSDADPGSCFDELGYGSPDRGVEHSSPNRGIVIWAILKQLGAEGLRERIRSHNDCASYIENRCRSELNLELLSKSELSICCFRYKPPQIKDTATLESLNQQILLTLRAKTNNYPSSTKINNKFAIRPCFIGGRSTLENAQNLVDSVLAIGDELSPQLQSRQVP